MEKQVRLNIWLLWGVLMGGLRTVTPDREREVRLIQV